MSQREDLRAELLELITKTKDGFSANTAETRRIDEVIDALIALRPYPGALNHPELIAGHWVTRYLSIGRLVGGDGAKDKGAGVTTSLRVFSMGRLSDVPATQVYTSLEIDPANAVYNFYQRLKLGENNVETNHFTYGRYGKKAENLDRFFVEFDTFEIQPADQALSPEAYREAAGIPPGDALIETLSPSPKLWSDVAYIDETLRIQLGQMGGHYVMVKTDLPLFSIEHAQGKPIDPPSEPPA